MGKGGPAHCRRTAPAHRHPRRQTRPRTSLTRRRPGMRRTKAIAAVPGDGDSTAVADQHRSRSVVHAQPFIRPVAESALANFQAEVSRTGFLLAFLEREGPLAPGRDRAVPGHPGLLGTGADRGPGRGRAHRSVPAGLRGLPHAGRRVPFERDLGMAVLLAHLSAPPPSLGSRRPDLPAAADRVLARWQPQRMDSLPCGGSVGSAPEGGVRRAGGCRLRQ